MRVLLVNHFPLQGSGSGIYTMNIAKELVNQGHEVFVVDIDNQVDTNDYNFERYTIMCDKSKNPEAKLSFNFPCFTTHPRSSLTYYDLNEEQIQEYINVYMQTIRAVISDFKPDVIHAQHLWLAPYVASKTNIPYVITAHGTDLMGFKKDERYRKYALEASQKAAFVIAISKQVYQETQELYHIPNEKLILNPNGFDETVFNIKPVKREDALRELDLPQNSEKIVSFVGKLTDFKGVDILIKAAKIVTEKIPEVIFALAGNGQLRDDLEKLAKDLGLNNIYFLGHKNQNQVATLYNLAEVSVVPSRIEPFGLVALEAMACGTPVVATNAGGLPDFVNKKVGALVEMNNPEELASALISEISQQTKLTKGKFANKYTLENFSWSKTLGKVIDLYELAIEDF